MGTLQPWTAGGGGTLPPPALGYMKAFKFAAAVKPRNLLFYPKHLTLMHLKPGVLVHLSPESSTNLTWLENLNPHAQVQRLMPIWVLHTL